MANFNIKYLKSCRGIFYSYDNKQIIDIRDYFRDDIIDSIKRSKINYYNRLTEKKIIYYADIPDTKIYIRDMKWVNDEGYNEVKYLLPRKGSKFNRYICPVTSEKYDILKKPLTLPQYYINIINGYAPEISYLENINGKDLFYHNDNNYVILPDMIKYPIGENDINNINNSKDIDNMYNLLYNYHFNLFIKDNTIRSIFDINIDLLKSIKETIINFYNRFFNTDNMLLLDLNKLNININADTKYDFIVIEFNLFNNYEGFRPLSFIQNYKLINLDNVLKLLEGGVDPKKISYYIRFNLTDKKTDTFCKGVNSLYDSVDKCLVYTNFQDCVNNKCFWNNMNYKCETFTDDSKKLLKKYNKCKNLKEADCGEDADCYYNLQNRKCYLRKKKEFTFVKKVDLDKLEEFTDPNPFTNLTEDNIVNYYADSEQEMTVYCKDFIILKIDNTYYHLSIKSITYDRLVSDNKLSERYQDKITDIINNNSPAYTYNSGNVSYRYYVGSAPAYAEITLTRLDRYIPKISSYFLETSDIYQNEILNIIKNGKIDNSLVISLAYFNLKRKNTILTKNIEKLFSEHLFLKQFANKLIDYSDNFVITTRSSENIKEGHYVLWYCPDIIIKDEDKFIQLLKQITNAHSDKDYREIYMDIRSNESYYNSITECTNFYDIFRSDQFIHDIRHLTKPYVKEIDSLIYKFTKSRYEDDYDRYLKDPYFVWLHYPNLIEYSILHINIAEFSRFNARDMVDRYISSSDKRYYMWDNIKNYNYMDKDIYIDTRVNKDNKEQNMINIMKRSGRSVLLQQ